MDQVSLKSEGVRPFFVITWPGITHVVVQNTTGFGIFGLSLKGDSRIFESALLYNHGDGNREGGNVLLTLADCDSSGNSN